MKAVKEILENREASYYREKETENHDRQNKNPGRKSA